MEAHSGALSGSSISDKTLKYILVIKVICFSSGLINVAQKSIFFIKNEFFNQKSIFFIKNEFFYPKIDFFYQKWFFLNQKSIFFIKNLFTKNRFFKQKLIFFIKYRIFWQKSRSWQQKILISQNQMSSKNVSANNLHIFFSKNFEKMRMSPQKEAVLIYAGACKKANDLIG